MEVWSGQQQRQRAFSGIGCLALLILLFTLYIVFTGGFEEAKGALAIIWGIILLVVIVAVITYVRAERCPKCGKRFSFTLEDEQTRTTRTQDGQSAVKEITRSWRCLECGYLKVETIQES